VQIVQKTQSVIPASKDDLNANDGRSDTLKVLAQNFLDEKLTATPALVETAIYIRTDKHLFAFANN